MSATNESLVAEFAEWRRGGRTISGLTRVGAVTAFVMLSFPLTAAADSFDNEFDEKPWSEIEVQLPAFPEKENLVPFKVGSVSDTQFMIDAKSITIGNDGVIRYALVVVSPAGARNISFEGIRCATGERRLYAFGQSDKTWSRARSDKWARIRGSSNQYPVALFADYLCVAGAPMIYSPEDVVRRLRYGH